MSIAVTEAAPRRSISKAQKPSHVPMSRQRLPVRSAGSGTFATVGRVSKNASVTMPGASSTVWYQLSFAARAPRSVGGRAVRIATAYGRRKDFAARASAAWTTRTDGFGRPS